MHTHSALCATLLSLGSFLGTSHGYAQTLDSSSDPVAAEPSGPPETSAEPDGEAPQDAEPGASEAAVAEPGAGEPARDPIAGEPASDPIASSESTATPASASVVQPVSVAEATQEPVEEADSDEEVNVQDVLPRVLATPGAAPRQFAIWQDDESFIKPVIQISALLAGYIPHSDVAEELNGRLSTLALARFGFEGELFGFLSFRSVFERNLGYSLGRNGPVGTSVWEGTASFQARENYVRLHYSGFSLTGGIYRDPSSVDYISENILDTFGMDPYVRDPLLVSGFSQGQGVMARYNWRWLTAGFSFSAGNPLTSSLAFGFAGDVSALGSLFSAPLRAFSSGIPGSDIQMYVMTPSLTFEHDVFDIKLAAQLYRVDVDITSDDDLRLTGYNLRATMRAKLLDERLSIYAGGAYRANEQLAVPDLTTRKDDYEGLLVNAGFDVRFGNFGAGGSYYWIRSSLAETSTFTNHYLNLGVTYWLRDPNVSVGFRWARSMTDFDTDPVTTPRLGATDSFTLSLRLLI